MKICINRETREGPWGGGNKFLKAYIRGLKAAGHQIVHKLEPNIDLIHVQDPRLDHLGVSIREIIHYKRIYPDVKIIHRVNECDARKGTIGMDKLLLLCSSASDITVFVSDWIANHFESSWECDNRLVIYNGVDQDIFRPNEKYNNKINIVAHHWSNNYLKGFDIYNKLDDWIGENRNEYTFTYIGREHGAFRNTRVIQPIHGKVLGDELGKYDVYVSASRFDPGPNHILEAVSCGLPTYSYVDGGGAYEFTGEKHVYSSFEELVEILKSKSFKKNETSVSSWEECVEQYMRLI